jgi:hypothetical protein
VQRLPSTHAVLPAPRLAGVHRVPNGRAAADLPAPPAAALPGRAVGTPRAFRDMAYDAFGERRLMLAVLEDAIRTLLLARRAVVPRKRVLRDRAWLESTSRSEPFDFESICDALGIDPSYLRARLLAGVNVPAPPLRARGPATGIRRATGSGNRSCSVSY